MNKLELLHLTYDNSKSYEGNAIIRIKQCSRQGEFKLSNVNFVAMRVV